MAEPTNTPNPFTPAPTTPPPAGGQTAPAGGGTPTVSPGEGAPTPLTASDLSSYRSSILNIPEREGPRITNAFGGNAVNTAGREEFADISDFMEYTTALNLDAGREVAELARGDNQGSFERFGHASARVASTASTDFLSFVGELGAIANPLTYFNLDQDKAGIFESGAGILDNIVNNGVSEGMRDFNDWVTEKTDVYSRSEDLGNEDSISDQMMSSTFWGNEGAAGIGFFLGSLIPSIAMEYLSGGTATPLVAARMARYTMSLGKFASKAKKMNAGMKAYRFGLKANKAKTFVGQTLLQTAQESFTESAYTANEVEDRLRERFENGEINEDTNLPYTEEDIIAGKEEALTRTFKNNMGILLFSNALETKLLFGSKSPSLSNFLKAGKRGAMGNKKRVFTDIAKGLSKVGQGAASEALMEEGPQTTIEGIIKDDILNGGLLLPGVHRMLGTYLDNALTDKETQKAMLLGGLLGAGGTTFATIKQAKGEAEYYNKLTKQRADIQGVIRKHGTDIYKTDEKGKIVTDPSSGLPVKDMEKISRNLKSMTSSMARSLYLDSLLQSGNKEEYTMEYMKEFAGIALQYVGHDEGFHAFKEDIAELPVEIKNQLIDQNSIMSDDKFRETMGEIANKVKETYDTMISGQETFTPVDYEKALKDFPDYDMKNYKADVEEYQQHLAMQAAIHSGVEFGADTLLENIDKGDMAHKVHNRPGKIEAYQKYKKLSNEGFESVFNSKDRQEDFSTFLAQKHRERNDISDLIDQVAKKKISETLDPQLMPIIDQFTFTQGITDVKEGKEYHAQVSAILELQGVELEKGTPNRWMITPTIKSNEITLVNQVTGEKIAIKGDNELIYKKKRQTATWSFNELSTAKSEAEKLRNVAFREAVRTTLDFYKNSAINLAEQRDTIKADIAEHKKLLKDLTDATKIASTNSAIIDLQNQIEDIDANIKEGTKFIDEISTLTEDIDSVKAEELMDSITAANNIIDHSAKIIASLKKQVEELSKTNDKTGLAEVQKRLAEAVKVESESYRTMLVTKQMVTSYMNQMGDDYYALYFDIGAVSDLATDNSTTDTLTDDNIDDMGVTDANDSDGNSYPEFNNWTSFLKTTYNEQSARASGDPQRIASVDYIASEPFKNLGDIELIHLDQLDKITDEGFRKSIRFHDGAALKTAETIENDKTGDKARTDIKVAFKDKNGNYVKKNGEYVYVSLPSETFMESEHQRFANQKNISDAALARAQEGYKLFRELASTKVITVTAMHRTGGKLLAKDKNLNTQLLDIVFESPSELKSLLKGGVSEVVYTVSENAGEADKHRVMTEKGFVGFNGMSYVRYKGRWMLMKNRNLSEDDVQMVIDVLTAAHKTKKPEDISRAESWLNGILHLSAKEADGPFVFHLNGAVKKRDGVTQKTSLYSLNIGDSKPVDMKAIAEEDADALEALRSFLRTKRYNINRHTDAHLKFQYPSRGKDGIEWTTTANSDVEYYAHMLSGNKFTVGLNSKESLKDNIVNVGIGFRLADVDKNAVENKMQKEDAPDVKPDQQPDGPYRPTLDVSQVKKWNNAKKAMESTDALEDGYYAITHVKNSMLTQKWRVERKNGEWYPLMYSAAIGMTTKAVKDYDGAKAKIDSFLVPNAKTVGDASKGIITVVKSNPEIPDGAIPPVVPPGGTDNNTPVLSIKNVEIDVEVGPEGSIISFQTETGEFAGHISYDNTTGTLSQIQETNIEPKFRGKGLGKEMYKLAGEHIASAGLVFKSHIFSSQTPEATNVWESLVKSGHAKKTATHYEYVAASTPPAKTDAEWKAEYDVELAAYNKMYNGNPPIPMPSFKLWKQNRIDDGGVNEIWTPYNEDQYTPFNEGMAWFAKKFPNMPVDIVQNALIEGVGAGKLAQSKTLMISTLANGSTLFHEGFHTANLVYNTKRQREALYNELRQRLGDKTVKVLTKKGMQSVVGKELSNELAEEYLATEFKDYMLSNGTYAFPADAVEQKTGFKRIWDAIVGFINRLAGRELKSIEEYFDFVKENPQFTKEGDVWIPQEAFEIGGMNGKETAKYIAHFNYMYFQTLTSEQNSYVEHEDGTKVEFGVRKLLNYNKKDQRDIYIQLYHSAKPKGLDKDGKPMSAGRWAYLFPQIIQHHTRTLQMINVEVDVVADVQENRSEDDAQRDNEQYTDNSISEADKVSKALRMFLLSVPNTSGDGKAVPQPLQIDGLAVDAVMVTNYRTLLNSLQNVLHDVPEHRVYDTLKRQVGKIDGVGYIIDYLGLAPNQDVDQYKLILRNAFYNQFNKTKNNPVTLYYDPINGAMLATSPLAASFSNKVKGVWQTKISSGTTAFTDGTLNPTTTNFTFSGGRSKPISQVTVADFNTEDDMYRFISRLGLDMNDLIKNFAPNTTYNDLVKAFINRFHGSIGTAAANNNGFIHARDLFNPEVMKIQKEIDELVNQVLTDAQDSDELSYTDAEGKRRYAVGEHTFLTNMMMTMKDASTYQTPGERFNALFKHGLAPYTNGKGSLMLDNDFFREMIDSPNKSNRHLSVVTMESMSTADRNVPFAQLSQSDMLLSNFNMIFKDYMPMPRTGSRKTDNFILNDGMIAEGMDSTKYVEKMTQFFYNEVARAWARDKGIGSDLKNYSNTKDGKLFSFEDVLDADGWKALTAYMEETGRDRNITESIENYFKDNNDLLEEVQGNILSDMEESVDRMTEKLKKFGIATSAPGGKWRIKGIPKGVLNMATGGTAQVGTDGELFITQEGLEALVNSYVAHWDISLELTTRLMFNDPMHLKGAGEVFKRGSGSNSGRQIMSLSDQTNSALGKSYKRTDGKEYGTTARVKIYADEMVKLQDGTTSSMSTELLKLYQKAVKDGAEGSDAQAIMNPNFGREILLRSGKWLDKHEVTFQYEMQQYYIGKGAKEMFEGDGVFAKHTEGKMPAKPMFDNKEINPNKLEAINTLKIQNFGRSKDMSKTDPNGLLSPTDFTKNSQAWMWPSQYSDSSLLEAVLANKVDYVSFPTGKKGDFNKNLQEFDMRAPLDERGLYEESLFNYGIQVETPYKNKDKVTLSKQLNRLLFNHMYGKDSKIADATRQGRVNEMYDDYNALLEASTVRAQQDLMVTLGIETTDAGETILKDPATFAERLQGALSGGQISKDMYDSVQTIMTSDTPYLELSPMKAIIESNIMAIIKKEAIQHKTHGRMLIQETDSVHRVKTDRTLPFYRLSEDGSKTLPMSVRMSLTHKLYGKVIEEYGSLEHFNSLLADPVLKLTVPIELREMVGNRVPSDDVHSIDYMEVVEYYPPWHGDRLVLPVESVIKSGTDFDVDKMTTYLNHLGDNFHKLNKDGTATSELIERIVNDPKELTRFFNHVGANYVSESVEKVINPFFSGAQLGTIEESIKEYMIQLAEERIEIHVAREILMEDDAYQAALDNFNRLKDQLTGVNEEDKGALKLMSEMGELMKETTTEYGNDDWNLADLRDARQQVKQEELDLRKAMHNVVGALIKEFNISAEDANSKGAVDNQMNKIRIEMLSQPESLENLLTPTVVTRIKDLAKSMNSAFGRDTDGYSKLPRNTLKSWKVLEAAEKMMSAQGSVGIVASGVVNHSMVRQHPISGTQFTRLFYQQYDKSSLEIGGNEISDGGRGTENVAVLNTQILNSFLDAEKDPFIFDTGITMETLAVVNMLMRMAPKGKVGMPLNEIARLINQPMVKEYLALKKGSVINAPMRSDEAFAAVTGESYKGTMASTYNKIKKNKLAGISSSREELALSTRMNQIASLTKTEMVSNSMSDARIADMMEIYLYYEAMAGDLTGLTQNTRFDSNMPSSKSQIRVALNKYDNFIKSNLAFNNEHIDNLMENSYLHSYKTVYENVSEMISPLFLSEDPVIYDQIMMQEEQRLSEQYMSERDIYTYLQALDNSISGYIFSAVNDGSVLFNETASLVQGDDSVAKIIRDVRNDPDMYNEFFAQILPVIDRYNKFTGREEEFDYVETLSRRIKPDDLEAIKHDIIIALKDEEATYKPIMDRLVKLGIAQTGLQGKTGSFLSLLPAQLFFDALTGKAKAFKAMNDIEKTALLDNFLPNFMQNNWYNSSVVARVPEFVKDRNGQLGSRFVKKGVKDLTKMEVFGNAPALTVRVPLMNRKEQAEAREKGKVVKAEILYYERTDFVHGSTEVSNYVLADKKGAPMLVEGPFRPSILKYNSKDVLLDLYKGVTTEPVTTHGTVDKQSIPVTVTEKKRIAAGGNAGGVVFSKNPIILNEPVTMSIQGKFSIEMAGYVARSGRPLGKPYAEMSQAAKDKILETLGFSSEAEAMQGGSPAEIAYINGDITDVYSYRVTKPGVTNAMHQAAVNNTDNPVVKKEPEVKIVDEAIDLWAKEQGVKMSDFNEVYAGLNPIAKGFKMDQLKKAFKENDTDSTFARKFIKDSIEIMQSSEETMSDLPMDSVLRQSVDGVYADFIKNRVSTQTIDEYIIDKICKG